MLNLLFICMIIQKNFGFMQRTRSSINTRPRLNIYMRNTDDYIQDVDLVQRYNFFFPKENYNDILQDLTSNKISKLYIDTTYKQLVSVDNLPKGDDILYNHYHLANINPIVVPNLVDKSSDLHIPIYFVPFIPESITGIQNTLSSLLGFLINYGIPILFVISILSSLTNNMPRPNISNMPMNKNNRGNNPFNLFSQEKNEFVKNSV